MRYDSQYLFDDTIFLQFLFNFYKYKALSVLFSVQMWGNHCILITIQTKSMQHEQFLI